MKQKLPDLSTDLAWEQWGLQEPYFGVITNQKFRRVELSDQTRREFFNSGNAHIDYVLDTIRRHITQTFKPARALDFGCGVGRTLIPIAKIAEHVVGFDVSPSMLKECQNNCDLFGITNVTLLICDDSLSQISKKFDFVHCFIVLQHIPTERGSAIFRGLLDSIESGGIGAIQILYSKAHYSATNGLAPPPDRKSAHKKKKKIEETQPEMQMNPYVINEILFAMQSKGVARFHADFTDHEGELGIFLFFQRN